MTSFKYKKFVSYFLVLVIAVITGFSVGRIYVDTLEPASVVSASEEDLRDSDSDIKTLVTKSQMSGAKPNVNFTGVQLFEIAEYKLNNAETFHKLMTGVVNAPMGIKQSMKSEKTKVGGMLIYNKLSPSSSSLSPSICSQIRYDYSTQEIKVNPKGTFLSTDADNIRGSFDESKFETYSAEKFLETFNTEPTTIIHYIISSKTCEQNKVSAVKDNGDGTYSFDISIDGDYLKLAALFYSYEIKFSSGLSGYPEWVSLNLSVTVDADFNFTEIKYVEVYKMYVSGIGYMAVTDNFVDHYSFTDVPTLEEVL